MKFETVRIYFLSEFSVCCHPKILLPCCYRSAAIIMVVTTTVSSVSCLRILGG